MLATCHRRNLRLPWWWLLTSVSLPLAACASHHARPATTDAAGVPGGQHGEIELDVCYKPDAHEDRSTMDGRDKRYVEKAEDTLLFAARMVNEEVRAEQARADGLMEEDGSDEEADRAGPDWLAGYQKYGTWKELVHGKPEQIRMPTGFVVEAFPTRVKQQAAYLFVGSS